MENTTPQPAAAPAPQPTAPVHAMNGSVMDVQAPRPASAVPTPQAPQAPLAPAFTEPTPSSIPSSQTHPVLHGWEAQAPAAPAPAATEPAPDVPVEPAAPAPVATAPAQSSEPTPAPEAAAQPQTSAPAPAPAEPAAQQPTSPPAQPATAGGVVPAPPEDKPTGPATPDAAKPADGATKNPMAIPSVPMKPHKRMPIGAFVATLVGCALIGLTVFVYTKQNNKSATANTSKSSTQAADTTQPITATDIDTAVAEIDKAMADMDDTADFAATDLSDTTLELQ